MAVLSDAAIETRFNALTGWSRAGSAISKTFRFGSFPDAIAFTVRLAFEAERADHHPDILIGYRHVTLTYTTHRAGGLTAKDFEGATIAEECAR